MPYTGWGKRGASSVCTLNVPMRKGVCQSQTEHGSAVKTFQGAQDLPLIETSLNLTVYVHISSFYINSDVKLMRMTTELVL